MISIWMKLGRSVQLAVVLSLAAIFVGCGSTPKPDPTYGESPDTNREGRLRVGDLLVITFSDLINPIPPFEGRVKDDGKITLTQNQDFVAAGKTVAELEKEIHQRYVPKYFVNLTVTVKAENRFFYVDGQVKRPDRQPYWGEITVLGAIAASNGFTEFAQPKKVKVIRANGKIETVNCIKARENPKLDLPVYPGDRIIVPRKFW